MDHLHLIIGRDAAAVPLDAIVPALEQALGRARHRAPVLALVGGTSAIHGDGKAIVQRFCDEHQAVLLRVSPDRARDAAFSCIPGSIAEPIWPTGPGVSSLLPGELATAGAERIAFAIDPPPNATPEAGATLWASWFFADDRDLSAWAVERSSRLGIPVAVLTADSHTQPCLVAAGGAIIAQLGGAGSAVAVHFSSAHAPALL